MMCKRLVVVALMACSATASAALMPSMEVGAPARSAARLSQLAMLQTTADAPRASAATPEHAESAGAAPQAAGEQQRALPPVPEPGIGILFLGGVVLLVLALHQRARRRAANRPGHYRH